MRRGLGGTLVLLFVGAALWSADVSALMEQGKAQFEKGDYSRALQTFGKVKKEDPTNPMAREYISKCMAKMTETEKAAKARRALLSGEPSTTVIGPKEVPPSWAVPAPPTAPQRSSHSTPPKKRGGHSAPLVPTAVIEKEKKPSPFIIKRDELTGVYTNKILEGQAISLVRKRNRVEVVAFMNRLFLPFTDCLVPEAIPAIETLSREIQSHPGQSTLLRAVDSLTPAVRHQMLDLPTRRVSILFSALLHGSLTEKTKEGRGHFTAADLDD